MGFSVKSKWRAILVLVAVMVALVPALSQLVWHGQLFGARATFPLDLEWMEGGMLLHSQRIATGQGIYVQPSLEFIPFLYTPLYQALLALLSFVFPLGYTLGRSITILAFSMSLAVLVVVAVLEEDRHWPRVLALGVGLLGAAMIVGSYAFTGAFYDLVRSDSLLLLFEVLALAYAYRGEGWKSAVFSGILIALGFFTKQTASIVGIGIGLGLLIVRFRRGFYYGFAAAIVLVAGLLFLVKTSDGWFWTYIFKLHQSHPFRKDAAFVHAPSETWHHAWPIFIALALVTLALALGRRLQRRDAILWTTAIAGEVSAIVGFGTMWAFSNAFIPAVFFPSLAVAILTARLVGAAVLTQKWGTSISALLVVALLGYQSFRIPLPAWKDMVPSSQDRKAATKLITTLKDLPNPLFIPFHPYYGVLAGKKPFVHRMGVRDVEEALGRPKGLDEALANQQFASIVLDWKSLPGEWPHLNTRYHVVHEFVEGVDSVRMFAGAQTSPRQLWIPTMQPPPLPPGGRRLFDFEGGDYTGFRVEGNAMGQGPAAAPIGCFGRYAVDTTRPGPAARGRLHSSSLLLHASHLSFTLLGPRDPKLRVAMYVEGNVVKSATPSGDRQTVVWELGPFAEQLVEIAIEDDSTQAGMMVDEMVAY